MSLLNEDEEALTVGEYAAEKRLLLDAYRELVEILEPFGIKPMVVGVAMRGPVKSLNIALSKPIPVDKLASVLVALAQALRDRGYRVLGEVIQMGRSSDDWILRMPIVIRAGEIAELRIFNVLNSDSSLESLETATGYSTYVSEIRRVTEDVKQSGKAVFKLVNINGIVVMWKYGLEDWERPLVVAAMYFVDPRPEEEVMSDMEVLVGREEAERIAALVWKIAFGEGYTDDEWFNLLESLKILSPWECVWRFQELASRGLRKKHSVEPANLSDKEVLRAACKEMGTG